MSINPNLSVGELQRDIRTYVPEFLSGTGRKLTTATEGELGTRTASFSFSATVMICLPKSPRGGRSLGGQECIQGGMYHSSAGQPPVHTCFRSPSGQRPRQESSKRN